MSKNTAPVYITLLAASQISGAHYTYLARSVRKGGIEFKKVGNRTLLLRSSFDEWNAKYQTRKQTLPPEISAATQGK